MSGSRLTRKVTVEGSKKVTDASAPRKSVFDRLGPGGLERSQSRRDDYSELLVEKCRYWMKDGRCPFGNKCRYDHGSTSEAKSKLKIIRSIVSKNEESGEKKSVVRVKRVHSPEDDLADHSPKKIAKRMKPESVKVTKESLREESQAFKENKKAQEQSKFAEKKKEITVRTLSTSSSGWNLQDNSDSEDGTEKQLDWEVRGAMHRAHNVALEERRNDLRRQIAKIDEHDQPVMTISNMPLGDDSSPPFQEEDTKPEKKKKSKSDKSKKKMKKKSHKNEVHRMEGFVGEVEHGEKPKKTKSSSGKKKKRHSNDSDREMQPVEVSHRKGEYESEVFQRDYYETKKRSDDFHSPLQIEQATKSRHSNDLRREKNPDSFELEARHYDKRNRSPVEARSSAFERKHQPPQFETEQHHDRELPRGQLDRETLQLEREERQFERETRQLERERQAQVEKESRQLKMESQHLERESRKTHYERESRQVHTEREPSRQAQFERESRPPKFERELRHPKFERECRQAPKESCQPALKRETRTAHPEKEIRSSHYQRSSTFDGRSDSPPIETRSSHLESLSPVMDRNHHQQQIEHSHTEEHITLSDHKKQKPSKTSVSQKVAESHSKEARVGKKLTLQRSPSGEKQQLGDQKEFVKEQRKPNSRDASSVHTEVKQRAKKTDKPEEVTASRIKHDQHQAKAQKAKFGHEVKRKKGPRTPSPEFKQLPLSLDIETAVALDTPAIWLQKREKRESRPKPPEPALPKEVTVPKKDKPVGREQVNESISESSDSNSSSSSVESQSEEVESGSADEVKSRNARKQHPKRETRKKKEVSPKKPKREQREKKKTSASRDHLAPAERSVEGTRERPVEDAKHFPEERERHPEDHKERASNNERHGDERFYREHARDHRRTRNEETDRRLDSRGSKDIRDARDSRDQRNYREFPRLSHRDLRERERFRGFDERECHHPFDVRRDYRDGPPDFRAGWSREMRGRDGYDPFDGREFNERREYERHFERDRPHPERGGRVREIEDHPDVAWYDRRKERDHRESERYHDGRERYEEDGKTSRTKRSRASLEPSRGERKGAKTRKERIRGSGTPMEESEEWDYEEGHSPAAPEVKDQQNSSRKRPKEASVRSPRPDSVKRKKVSPPETLTQMAAEGSFNAVEKKVSTSKEDEKDSKKSKKDKSERKARQKLEEETGSIEAAAASPESKQVRETLKDKDDKKAKFEGQTETTKRRDSDVEADGKTGKEVNNTEEAEKLSIAKPEEKCDEQIFSDWSDGSEVNALRKLDSGTTVVESQEQDKVGKVKNEHDNFDDGSVEDVYDPISDDELEAIISDDKQESIVRERTHTLDIEDVDWSILEGKSEKISEPGDYTKRFSAGNIFSRVGFSSALGGPTLSNTVREKCAQDASDEDMKDLLVPSGHVKLRIGALIAADARKMKQRASVVNDIGPCRRALCARRDFHIRKQLRRLTATKLGTKLLLDNSAVEHVDSELLSMSVSIFRRRVTDVKDESPTQPSTLLKSPEVLAC